MATATVHLSRPQYPQTVISTTITTSMNVTSNSVSQSFGSYNVLSGDLMSVLITFSGSNFDYLTYGVAVTITMTTS